MFVYEMNGFMIIIIAICLIAAVCVAAVLLYSYAAGKQVKHLQNIDEQLDEESIAVRIVHDGMKTSPPFTVTEQRRKETDAEKAFCEKTVSPETIMEQTQEEKAQAASGSEQRHITDMSYNVGRSGKIYTKKELEAQIRE